MSRPKALFLGIRWEACAAFVAMMESYGYQTAVMTFEGTQVQSHAEALLSAEMLPFLAKNKAEALATLRSYLNKTDVRIVLSAGFPYILPAEMLQCGAIFLNSHPHLLPEYKGANAIRESIALGAGEFGVTTHFMVPEVDSGAIILRQKIAFDPARPAALDCLYNLLFAYMEPATIAQTISILREQGTL